MADGCALVAPLVSAWFDGELDDGQARRVATHLASCEACSADAAALARTRAALRSLPVRQLPPQLADPVRLRAHWSHGRWSALRARRVAVGVVAFVGAVAGTAFALGGAPATRPAPAQLVTVPVDAFAADHLVHTSGGPLGPPALSPAVPNAGGTVFVGTLLATPATTAAAGR